MITNNQFCYWDCKSVPDAIILLINCLVTFVILVIATGYCYQFYKVYKLQIKKSKAIYTKFLGIITWALIFIINVIYSLVVYYFYFDSKTDKQIGSNITFYSRFYAFLETIPAMIVQTLLFTTAETMYIRINTEQLTAWAYCSKISINPQNHRGGFINSSGDIMYYDIHLSFAGFWYQSHLKIPMFYRSSLKWFRKIILLMVDCGIIIGLLRFCHRYMISNSQMLLPDRIRDRNKLVFETKLLTICGICRLLMNLIFYIVFPLIFTIIAKDSEDDNDKPCIQEAQKHLEFSIGYLGIGTYIMGHACIITIIKIYKPNNGRSSMIQSGSFIHFSDNNLDKVENSK